MCLKNTVGFEPTILALQANALDQTVLCIHISDKTDETYQSRHLLTKEIIQNKKKTANCGWGI